MSANETPRFETLQLHAGYVKNTNYYYNNNNYWMSGP